MAWPKKLPVLPNHFKKSTIVGEFEAADKETRALTTSVWLAVRNFELDADNAAKIIKKPTTTTTTTTTTTITITTWPAEPATMRNLVVAVLMYCDYIVRYESFCMDLMDWADDNGDGAVMSVVEDRFYDVSMMAKDVMKDVRRKGRVDEEVVHAVCAMFATIDND
jgi:hypothetical protein